MPHIVTTCSRCGGGTNNPKGPCICALHPAARYMAQQEQARKELEVIVTLPALALVVVIMFLSSLGLGFLVYLVVDFLGKLQ